MLDPKTIVETSLAVAFTDTATKIYQLPDGELKSLLVSCLVRELRTIEQKSIISDRAQVGI